MILGKAFTNQKVEANKVKAFALLNMREMTVSYFISIEGDFEPFTL